MWVFLWIVLSAFILGIFAWSQIILFQQKAAWKNFAKKRGLSFQDTGFSSVPLVTGGIEGCRWTFHTDSQQAPDLRGQRLVTVIEIELPAGFPISGAVGTEQSAQFIGTLALLDQVYEPNERQHWDESYIAKTNNINGMNAYLTSGRLKALKAIFSIKGILSMFLFDAEGGVLRLETPDPLSDQARLEKIVERLISVVNVLRVDTTSKQKEPEDGEVSGQDQREISQDENTTKEGEEI